ncbi:TPA: hypothetical protein U1343_002120, partial [Streptococcus suis]|nr:hypothetical protein [Streptococcus suis]
MTNDEYLQEIEQYITQLNQYREESKTLAASMIGENFTQDEMFFVSALNRRVQFIDGVILLLRERNLTCAGVLVRTQLDNLMRVFAAFISKDRQQFVDDYLNGKAIRNMLDADGNKMTDVYLKRRISEYYPEINEIYYRSSGYVHLSSVAFHETFWSNGENGFRFAVGFPPREELNIILIECAEVFCYFTKAEFDLF